MIFIFSLENIMTYIIDIFVRTLDRYELFKRKNDYT